MKTVPFTTKKYAVKVSYMPTLVFDCREHAVEFVGNILRAKIARVSADRIEGFVENPTITLWPIDVDQNDNIVREATAEALLCG